MLRHIARVLWFKENKACVGLSSGSRTNACMPDDWESLSTCTVEPGICGYRFRQVFLLCACCVKCFVSVVYPCFSKRYWMNCSFVLDERVISTGWAAHWYWMRNIDNITLAVIALIGKDRAWKTAAWKRGIEHYCRRDFMPYSSKIYRVMM